ncbi:hypothetical protein NSP_44720 [Nodularia spumigena CCY9414]|nr:hypothetical protein NSP_44720 [Nodularia spumigena CCY9414]
MDKYRIYSLLAKKEFFRGTNNHSLFQKIINYSYLIVRLCS